ncbi:hypothetical protein [Marinobacter sp.]|uniref:hypothetical protein n=1 Tax=Marinobacter sp. TaxID=50741 RepID=UPI00384E1D17
MSTKRKPDHRARAANQPSPQRLRQGGRPAVPGKSQAPIKRPEKLPLLDAICQKLNQRVNLEDEPRVLGLYERGWIFKGVLTNLDGPEARYVRALATRYNSWIARQVA